MRRKRASGCKALAQLPQSGLRGGKWRCRWRLEMELDKKMEACKLHKFPRSQNSLPQCQHRQPRETPLPAAMPRGTLAMEPYPCTRSNLQQDKV